MLRAMSVEFVRVSKRFGDRTAVDALDLAATAGELLVLLGPSGCGKSTALRMVAGLETPTEGEVRIDGRRVNDVLPKDRDVAMVFQNYALYPHLTVRQNLAFPLARRGVPAAEAEARVADTARRLGLGPHLDRRPGELSGGERQRVAMGRALVRAPKVFLFDEPLSNLDARLRVELRGEVARLHAESGATSLYVTHDQTEAMALGDRIAVLSEGRLQQVETPAAIYSRPANRFVAAFVGTPAMNLIAADRSDGDFHAGPFRFGATTEAARVLAGVRPEDVAVATDGQGANATVERVEPLGAETHLFLSAAGTKLVARAPGSSALRAGDAVRATAVAGRIHLFDAHSGARIGAA